MDFLSNIVVFTVLFNIVFVSYIGITHEVNWWLLLLSLPSTAMYALRRIIKIKIVFILLHIAILAAPFFIFNNSAILRLIVIYLIISVIHSINSYFKTELRPNFVVALIGILIVFAAYATPNNLMDRVVIDSGVSYISNISTIVILISAMQFSHMEKLHYNFSLVRTKTDEKILGNMMQLNTKFGVIICAIISVLAVVSMLLPASQIVGMLWRPFAFLFYNISRLFVWLAAAIFPQWPPRIAESTRNERNPGHMFGGADAVVSPPDSSSIFGQLSVITILVITAAIALLIFVAVFLYKNYSKKRASVKATKNSNGLTVTNLSFSFKDVLAAALPKLRSGPRHPIRKAFYKKVTKHIKKGVNIMPSHAPDKIAKAIRPIENIDDLTEAYKAARYGKEAV